MSLLSNTKDRHRGFSISPAHYAAVNAKKRPILIFTPRLWDNQCLSAIYPAGMAKDSPIQFKGTTLKIIPTQLRTTDPATLHEALADLTGNNPDFFENELAVLDFSPAENLPESAD